MEEIRKKVLLTATVQSHICQFHRPLVEMLHAHGWEVHVAARDNLAEKNGLKLDFADKVYDVPFARSPRSRDNVTAYRQIRKILEDGQYDVIHCNTPMGGIVTRLAARQARRRGARVIYTAHGFHFYRGAPLLNWLIYYPIEWLFAHWTDTLITINEEDERLAGRHFHTRAARIHGVGANERRYTPASPERRSELRAQLGFDDRQKIILCVGELLPNKNQRMAIRAMRQIAQAYPEAVLLVFGNGPERANLEAFAAENGVADSVRFPGYCTNLEQYQQIADVSVACSRREGLPLNILETMLSARPVVASRNRGHCELVRSGQTGYLVDVDDDAEMAARVCELLGDEKRAAAMGAEGERAAQPYCFSAVRQELERIYFGGKEQ